jgi:hypothetical protein
MYIGFVWSSGLGHVVLGDRSRIMVIQPEVRAAQRTRKRKINCMVEGLCSKL